MHVDILYKWFRARYVFISVFSFIFNHQSIISQLYHHLQTGIAFSVYHMHTIFIYFILCPCQADSMLTASQCSFQSLITYHQKRRFCVLPFFPHPRPEWRKRKRRGKKKKKERSWVMDALCLSVIPNYWTLPFKASLHFSFLPFWLMKSRLWLGALCFKHCLASLSAFTSVTICHIARSCSAMHFFLICYSHVQLSYA